MRPLPNNYQRLMRLARHLRRLMRARVNNWRWRERQKEKKGKRIPKWMELLRDTPRSQSWREDH